MKTNVQQKLLYRHVKRQKSFSALKNGAVARRQCYYYIWQTFANAVCDITAASSPRATAL